MIRNHRCAGWAGSAIALPCRWWTWPLPFWGRSCIGNIGTGSSPLSGPPFASSWGRFGCPSSMRLATRCGRSPIGSNSKMDRCRIDPERHPLFPLPVGREIRRLAVCGGRAWWQADQRLPPRSKFGALGLLSVWQRVRALFFPSVGTSRQFWPKFWHWALRFLFSRLRCRFLRGWACCPYRGFGRCLGLILRRWVLWEPSYFGSRTFLKSCQSIII